MKRYGLCVLVLCGVFYFSEGKPCPEPARPHKTRCDAFYKCQEMQTDRHVWVPAQCEKGLVYEHHLHICVLPADDWECLLGEVTERTSSSPKDPEEYVLSNDEVVLEDSAKEDRGDVELIVDSSMNGYDDSDEGGLFDSSGDGGEQVELDGFMQAEKRETEDSDKLKVNSVEMKDGGGGAASSPAMTSTNHQVSSEQDSAPSKIDPKLTAHLQRLSQLIDGLKGTYQDKDHEQQDMRPDQLNAFLAHFNIKNKFQTFNPQDSKDSAEVMPTATTPMSPISPATERIILRNATDEKKLQPETKVVLSNGLPHPFNSNGYSNSQIVVNRPEGSVLFTLPSAYGGEAMHDHSMEYMHHAHNAPKISEETLKTVLELSKQMIASQNMPKVIPNPAYYPQPIYPWFVAPGSGYPGSSNKHPFASYYQQNNNNNQNQEGPDYDTDDKMDGLGSSYHKPNHYHGHKKPSKNRPISVSSGGYGSKPGTTIIHNNVIPLHVTSTNSGEKEVVDSYGQSLGLYPPISTDGGHVHHHHSHRYQNNKFITSVTTVRPIVSTTSSPNHYVGQYPSPYPGEISVTTPDSLNVAGYYTPSPHLSESNANSVFQYENVPRPMDLNRPSGGYQPQMERPTPTPSSPYYQSTGLGQQGLFPSSIDPHKIQIRPNSQKIESMEETDGEEVVSAAYQQQQQPQILTYSYGSGGGGGGDKTGVTHQLAPPILSGSSHPYMSRPSVYSASSSSGGGGGGTVNIASGKPKYPENSQLVNVGGNFISYDVFQNSILPLVGGGSVDDLNANVEVITCAVGVRQPNTTDCTRYYVCSKKDGKVLSYSCPPYTAFNPQTRICDARTYTYCSPEAVVSTYTVNENKRIQMEAFKAIQEAKRRREQALKVQNNLSALLSHYDSSPDVLGSGGNTDKDMLGAYMAQAASLGGGGSTTTMRPSVVSSMTSKKRKYYCKEGDKIADQTSITSYFVCYKNAQGQMKGHKMSCSKGLVFCPKSRMCTLTSKCA